MQDLSRQKKMIIIHGPYSLQTFPVFRTAWEPCQQDYDVRFASPLKPDQPSNNNNIFK